MSNPPGAETPRFIPDVLPPAYMDSSSNPDASEGIEPAIPGTYTSTTKQETKDTGYDPNKSIVFRSVPCVNFDLVAYIVIGLALFLLCFFILSSSLPNYGIYVAKSTFFGPIPLFIGGLISALTLSFAAYQVRSTGMFALFLLAQVALVFWYFNLMFRIEQVADGGNHDGNGAGYLAIALFLMLGMVYMAWGRNVSAALLMLVPVIWYSIVFYYWLNDGI